MKNGFTKEEIRQAHIDIATNQSILGIFLGAALGVLIAFFMWMLVALFMLPPFIAIPILLFVTPALVGFLVGQLGKPYQFIYKAIIFIFGMSSFAMAFIIYNKFLIYLMPIAGLVSVYCSNFHMSEVQKYAIREKTYV